MLGIPGFKAERTLLSFWLTVPTLNKHFIQIHSLRGDFSQLNVDRGMSICPSPGMSISWDQVYFLLETLVPTQHLGPGCQPCPPQPGRPGGGDGNLGSGQAGCLLEKTCPMVCSLGAQRRC